MSAKVIPTDLLHTVPSDLQSLLDSSTTLSQKWAALTPLARNEWICWATIVKKPETRAAHLVRLRDEITAGKTRPCCWPGCPHRRPSAKKWFKLK